MDKQPLLFVMQSAPYDGHSAVEGLEALYAARIFDVPCAVVFIGDGVRQLIANQQYEKSKNVEKLLLALPMYDIDEILVSESALLSRGVSAQSIPHPYKLVTDDELTTLFHQYAHCLSF